MKEKSGNFKESSHSSGMYKSNSSESLLLKMKEQYQQSLSVFKETVSDEVENMFDTIQITLEEMNLKINKTEKKLNAAEQNQSTIIRVHRNLEKENEINI